MIENFTMGWVNKINASQMKERAYNILHKRGKLLHVTVKHQLKADFNQIQKGIRVFLMSEVMLKKLNTIKNKVFRYENETVNYFITIQKINNEN